MNQNDKINSNFKFIFAFFASLLCIILLLDYVEYQIKKEDFNNYVNLHLSENKDYQDFFITTEKHLNHSFPLSERNVLFNSKKIEVKNKLYNFKINFLNKIIKDDFNDFMYSSKENYFITYKNANIVYKDICLNEKLKEEIKLMCEDVNLKLEKMKVKLIKSN